MFSLISWPFILSYSMLYLFLVLICVTRPNVPGMLRRDISRRFIIIIIIIIIKEARPVLTQATGNHFRWRERYHHVSTADFADRCSSKSIWQCTSAFYQQLKRGMTNYPIGPWTVALIIHCCSLYLCPVQLTCYLSDDGLIKPSF